MKQNWKVSVPKEPIAKNDQNSSCPQPCSPGIFSRADKPLNLFLHGIRAAKNKEMGTWVLSKPNRQKIKNRYAHDAGPYGSVRNWSIVKHIIDPIKENRSFLFVTFNTWSMNSFSGFKIEACYRKVVFFEALAKE